MSGFNDTKVDPTLQGDKSMEHGFEEKKIQHNELLDDSHAMTSAFDAENAEHAMTAWQAVKTHPMACFWAFLMCFTIVSFHATVPSQWYWYSRLLNSTR